VPYGKSVTDLFVDDFVEAVRMATTRRSRSDDAREVAAVLDAAYASARTGQVVAIA